MPRKEVLEMLNFYSLDQPPDNNNDVDNCNDNGNSKQYFQQ